MKRALGDGYELDDDRARLEPADRVARLKTPERANQRLLSARKPGGHLPRIETGMGHIAAPAARNPDFGEELRASFEQRDARVRRGFGASDGRKKTGGASARHNDPS